MNSYKSYRNISKMV